MSHSHPPLLKIKVTKGFFPHSNAIEEEQFLKEPFFYELKNHKEPFVQWMLNGTIDA